MGRYLEAAAAVEDADRPEALSLGPHGTGEAADKLLDFVRSGICREIDVDGVVGLHPARAPRDGVAHRSPYEIELLAGGREALCKGPYQLEDRLEAVGDHDGRGYLARARQPSRGASVWSRRAAATASRAISSAGPPPVAGSGR